jgi:hypothetical protein
MKKTILACLMAVLCLAFTACSGKNNESETVKNVPVSDILAAVKAAYGDDYLPNASLPEEALTETFGLDMKWVEEYAAEAPMISVHPDRVVIVKATAGNADAVEEAFQTARENAISDTMIYPMNVAKVNAAQVLRKGDYVAYFLVGAPDDTSETEEEAKKFAEEQVKKAVDAFNGCFE